MKANFLKFLFAALAFSFSITFATTVNDGSEASHHCGTMNALQHQRSQSKGQAIVGRSLFSPQCSVSDYYDSVYTRKTTHFEIFYTLNGIHATTEAFVDSVAVDFEKAWNLYVNKLYMRIPTGSQKTFHYEKDIDDGLYPIEILDLTSMRNHSSVLGSDGCTSGCFGVTYPTEASDPQKTQIFLDNDFRYVPYRNVEYDSIKVQDRYCSYPVASSDLINARNYADNWALGIRVTAFHELYHAVQLRYFNLYTHWTFWFEASATGMEEIGAPDIDDYISYLDFLFNFIGTPLDQSNFEYSGAAFFLYLYNHYHSSIDKQIWENFEMYPSMDFKQQLSDILATKKISVDSLFQDFSTRLSFSNKRSANVDSSFWIVKDQPNWPEIIYSQSDGAVPELSEFSFRFYNETDMDLTNFVGSATVALYTDGEVSFRSIQNTATLDSIRSKSNQYDSLTWILSRFGETNIIPELVKDSTLRAYPVPWREGNLCFTPLPLNKDFIEIRTRRGDLVWRENYSKTTHCIDENTVREKMRPGVYRFRAGTKGKTRDFIVIY